MDLIWKLGGAYKHKVALALPCVCLPSQITCLLMLDVRFTEETYKNTLSIGPYFLVSPFFSIPHALPSTTILALLSQVRSQTIPRIREMDGLSGCLCCLDANTLLSYAGCPFRQLMESTGKGGPRDRGVCVDNKIFYTDWSRFFFPPTRERVWRIISSLPGLCS